MTGRKTKNGGADNGDGGGDNDRLKSDRDSRATIEKLAAIRERAKNLRETNNAKATSEENTPNPTPEKPAKIIGNTGNKSNRSVTTQNLATALNTLKKEAEATEKLITEKLAASKSDVKAKAPFAPPSSPPADAKSKPADAKLRTPPVVLAGPSPLRNQKKPLEAIKKSIAEQKKARFIKDKIRQANKKLKSEQDETQKPSTPPTPQQGKHNTSVDELKKPLQPAHEAIVSGQSVHQTKAPPNNAEKPTITHKLFSAIAKHSVDHAWKVIVSFVILAALATGFSAWKLEVNTDPGQMISGDLPFRQSFHDLTQAFPQLDQTFTVVIDAKDGEGGRETARLLVQAFTERSDLFEDVYSPGASDFFDVYGLLYLPPDQVKRAVAQVREAAPMIKILADRPDLAGLAGLMAGLVPAAKAGKLPPSFAVFLDETAATVKGEIARKPHIFDWSRMALHEREISASQWYVFVKPKLDFSALDPAAAAMTEARRIIADPAIIKNRAARLRLTGEAAMNAEEFESVTNGAAIAGIASLIIVTIVIGLGMPAVRLIIPALGMLLLGFMLNAGFATASIGSLNMISVAFAVLFIGLGIDYAVHIILRYWENRCAGLNARNGAIAAVQKAGPALGVCTLTTALAFLAFVPTDFVGMSQLGIIAAGGIVIAYIASMTLIPAMLSLLPLSPAQTKAPKKNPQTVKRRQFAWYQLRLATTIFAILVAIAGGVLMRQVVFDGDPVNLKDPASAAVITFKDLLLNEPGEAYAAHVMVANGAQAHEMMGNLQKLPQVAQVRSIESFLPRQQLEKLHDLTALRGVLPGSVAATSRLPSGIRRASIEGVKSDLRVIFGAKKADPLIRAAAKNLHDDLVQLDAKKTASEVQLEQLEGNLFADLPQLIIHLNRLAAAEPINAKNMDHDIRDRYVAADGRWRLEVVPSGDLRKEKQLRDFVTAIKAVAPQATGAPVEIAGAADVVSHSMKTATLAAFITLLFVLIPLLRRVDDVLLVLAPLVIAAMLLIAYTVIFHSPFNFANVIVLPLLLGLGVDAAVHYVMRAREEGAAMAVGQTSTPRAVVIAALTTIGSFGTLWLSRHKGMSSMGEFLTVAIIITLICTTIVLPQLIAWSDAIKHHYQHKIKR